MQGCHRRDAGTSHAERNLESLPVIGVGVIPGQVTIVLEPVRLNKNDDGNCRDQEAKGECEKETKLLACGKLKLPKSKRGENSNGHFRDKT